MILARASLYSMALPLALVAAGAQADVMEIDADGARWVAGGTPAPAALSEIIGADIVTGLTEEERAALETLVVPDHVVSDTTEHAADIPAEYKPKIHELARRFDLSPALLEAVVWQESRWRANAVSHAGARGLAQLMPGTAEYLGVDPDDPMQNLEGGARYLREQLDRFDGDIEKALAAYNAGPGRVIRAGGVPNIRETRQYVAAIMGRLSDHSRPDAQ